MKHTFITDPAHAATAVAWFLNRPPCEVIGIDLETAKHPEYITHPQAGLNPDLSRIRLVQLAAGERVAVIDAFQVPVQVIAPLMKRGLVAHNADFEMRFLLASGLNPKRLHCTLLADRVVSGARRTLADVSLAYLCEMVDKKLQKSDWGARELSLEQREYAAKDAMLVYRLYPVLQERLAAFPNGREAYKVLLRAMRPIAKAECAGLPFDRDSHVRLCEQWEAERATAQQTLAQAMGPDLNPDSPVQLAQWLGKVLPSDALQQWPRTGGGKLSTRADALQAAEGLAVVKPLLAYKESSKRCSAFGHDFARRLSPVTGRFHPSFKIGGAATFRFACSDPNVQQFPRDKTFRRLVCAAPGRQLVVADYSQVELRIMALLSRDPTMLAAYQEGKDLHRLTAASIAGIPFEAVTKAQRQAAKAINFGLIYGMGIPTLVAYAKSTYGVTLTLPEATTAWTTFFKTYPRVKTWQTRTVAETRVSRQTLIPGGFVRRFAPAPTTAPYTQALNTPDQGAGAAAMLYALPLLDKALAGMDAHLVNAVHDELVLEVAEADVPGVQLALEAAMTTGFETVFPEARALGLCKGLVEAHAGRDWVEAKP